MALYASTTATMRAGQRDRLTAQPIRVAGAVPSLVMMTDRGRGVGELGHLAHQMLADHDVLAHDLPLVLGERAGLVQDVVGHGHLADVVQPAGEPAADGVDRRSAAAPARPGTTARRRPPGGSAACPRGRRPRSRRSGRGARRPARARPRRRGRRAARRSCGPAFLAAYSARSARSISPAGSASRGSFEAAPTETVSGKREPRISAGVSSTASRTRSPADSRSSRPANPGSSTTNSSPPQRASVS